MVHDSDRTKSVLDAIGLPAFAVDGAGKVSGWNVQLEEKERLPMSKLSSFSGTLKSSVDKEAWERALQECMASGEPQACHVSIAAVPRQQIRLVGFMDQGERTGVLCFVHPASEHTESMTSASSEGTLDLHTDYGRVLEDASTPVFAVDKNGVVDFWNGCTEEKTGYSRDLVLNKRLVDAFIPEMHRNPIASLQARALQGRSASSYELELCTRDGVQVIHLVVTLTPRRTTDGTINGVLYIAHNATDSCKHNRAVFAIARELRGLIDTANTPIFGVDSDGDINEWNHRTEKLTGFTRGEAFDHSLVDTFIAQPARGTVREVLNNARHGRGTTNFELEFPTTSGEIRHLLVNATTRKGTSLHSTGMVGVAQDVTESVQRDRAVAGMAQELRQLIDAANAPIFGIDVDGNVNEWNRCTRLLTGYSKEETFDEQLVDFIAPAMRAKVEDVLQSALHGNETTNYEVEFISKSGESRILLVNATTRRDPDFNVVGVVGVGQDVTEDRKHAAELRRMQCLQAAASAKVETERNMTAYFAHELRNPLGAIDSALSAMPDDLPESTQDLVSGMKLCSSFMSTIMNNLLDVRKMEEGKMTLTRKPIHIMTVLEQVHKMLRPAVKPGVQFRIENCDTLANVWALGDEHRIQQVLANVVTNAIKYTIAGCITLKVDWQDDMVRFECIDTGPGIPKREQEKLFQRFVQRGGAPGSGLGLAIAKHLVELAGGFIEFQSDPSIRPGTTCLVAMPLNPVECPETPSNEYTELEIIQEPLKLLIVDDIKMNRTMLIRRIKKGIAPRSTTTEAATGEEALKLCGTQPFDVIIVDQYMEEAGGVMVGTDVVFAMRRMRINAIIIGCSGNDLRNEFEEAGADWVWQKPIPSNKTILEKLRSELSKRNLSTAAGT